MPHPIGSVEPFHWTCNDANALATRRRDGGILTCNGEGHLGGQIVIRHDRSTTKKKRLRQRQRVR